MLRLSQRATVFLDPDWSALARAVGATLTSETNNQVVVVVNNVVAVLQDVVGLVASDVVDALGESLVGMQRLPSGHSWSSQMQLTSKEQLTVSANKRVNCAQVIAIDRKSVV